MSASWHRTKRRELYHGVILGGADLQAGATFNTLGLVNDLYFPFLTADCLGRADQHTMLTPPITLIGEDIISNELLTD